MALPKGAVTVVVISFIFVFLAMLALTSRLWARRIMGIKLRLNDYAAILAIVVSSEQSEMRISSVPWLTLHSFSTPPWFRSL